MVFTKHLREGVRRGLIKCSVRIWQRPHVKAGGRYPMDDGQIVVDSITKIRLKDITYDLARESGFASVKDLRRVGRASMMATPRAFRSTSPPQKM